MKYHKFTAILLIIYSIMILSPSAANAAKGDILYECGFENNSHTGWYANGDGGWGGANCTITTNESEVYDGHASAKLTYNSSSGSAYFAIQKAVTGGYGYELSAFINADVESGNGFAIEVVYGIGNANSNVIGSAPKEMYHVTNNVYTKITVSFVAPEECDIIMIRPRLYGIGTVLIDNILIRETAGPEPFSIETSHVFHYTDQTEGTATVRLHSYYGAESDEGKSTVLFTIQDGDTIIKQDEIPFVNQEAIFRYSVHACLNELKKRYDFTVQVKYADGTLAKEHKQGLYLYERPSRINAEGEYLINGKVFHPVFTYHIDIPQPNTIDDDNAYMQAKKAGINLVTLSMSNCRYNQSDKFMYALEQLEKYDLYGIVCLYSNHRAASGNIVPCSAAGCNEELENTKLMSELIAEMDNSVDKADKSARVFAYVLMDEPFGSGNANASRCEELEIAYHEIRQRDSIRPIWCVDYNKAAYAQDLKYCDVFVPDNYSTTLDGVLNTTKIAVEEAKKAGNKPVYPLVKAFKSSGNLTFVTGEQLRHIVYQAVLAGGDGVGFYSFSDCIPADISETGKDIPIYQTELWSTMEQFKKEIPLLFETAIRKSYTETTTNAYIMRNYGERAVFLPLSTQNSTVPIDNKYGAIIYYGGSDKLIKFLGRYYIKAGGYTPLLFSYETPLQIWKGNTLATEISSGEYKITYAEGTADLYVVLYDTNSRIKEILVAKKTEALTVTVPDGVFKISAFAWSSGSLQPLTSKKSLFN